MGIKHAMIVLQKDVINFFKYYYMCKKFCDILIELSVMLIKSNKKISSDSLKKEKLNYQVSDKNKFNIVILNGISKIS